MADHPTITPAGEILFASPAALVEAVPRLRIGTLIALGSAGPAGSVVPMRLKVANSTVEFSSRGKVVTVVETRVLLRLLDVDDAMLAAIRALASAPPAAQPSAPEAAFAQASRMLADAANRMKQLSAKAAMDTPRSTPAPSLMASGGQPIMIAPPVVEPVAPPVRLFPSGHLEYGTAEQLLTHADALGREAGLVAEWTGAEPPAFQPQLFLVHALGHPAVADVMGEIVPMEGKQVAVVFKDRGALDCALQGLKQALSMASDSKEHPPHLPAVDASLDVHFASVPAFFAILPMVQTLNCVRARWTDTRPPPSGPCDLAVSLLNCPERLVLRGEFGQPRGGVVTITLQRGPQTRARIEQWIEQLRPHLSQPLPHVRAVQTQDA